MAWYVYAIVAIGSYIYHRATRKTPPKPKPASEIALPKIDEGSNVPIVYGRYRVRSPILAWTSDATTAEVAIATSPSGFEYKMDMLFILGLGFANGAVKLWNMWTGDMKMLNLGWGGNDSANGIAPWTGVQGDTTSPTESGRFTCPKPRETGNINGWVQLYDGRALQTHTLAIAPFNGISQLGIAMRADGVPGQEIPGFRGYMAVAHFGNSVIGKWQVGGDPNLGAYSYEVSSYPADSDAFNIGLEANPAKVLYDLLTAKFGKLAIPTTRIDGASFAAAKVRLQEEGNGYSRCIEAGTEAGEIIREILEQIDGVLYEDPSDGLIKLKLIRADYAYTTLPHITTNNCEELESFVPGGWEGVANKVRVVFADRQSDYQEKSAAAHNQAFGLNHETQEVVLHFPGVCTRALAERIAARELSARSRPLASCVAIVSRDFYTVTPGDPIALTWPEYGVDNRVFRVAAVNHGSLENGRIRLELIEDFFHVWRSSLTSDVDVSDLPPFELA